MGNVLAHHLAKNKHKELADSSNQAKYEELRLFLNAIESLNNILDYFYFEYESQLSAMHQTVHSFRSAAHKSFNALNKLADLANAYKHCIRTSRGRKSGGLPDAKDLQRPTINISIDISSKITPKTEIAYSFQWPIYEHEQILGTAVEFWNGDYSALFNI